MEMIPNENFPRIVDCQPKMIKVESGKIYSCCTCGLSEKQPFCDGSHKKEAGMPFRSMKVQFEKETDVYFCQCKHSKTPPFCDGSHHTIKEK